MKRQDIYVAFRHIYAWESSSKKNIFYDRFFDMLLVADDSQKLKIAKCFPAETAAFSIWFSADDKSKLYDKYGITS